MSAVAGSSYASYGEDQHVNIYKNWNSLSPRFQFYANLVVFFLYLVTQTVMLKNNHHLIQKDLKVVLFFYLLGLFLQLVFSALILAFQDQ